MSYDVNCRMYDQALRRNSVIEGQTVNLSGKMVAYISQKVTTRTASPFAFDPEPLDNS
jgi:hypothetical protein